MSGLLSSDLAEDTGDGHALVSAAAQVMNVDSMGWIDDAFEEGGKRSKGKGIRALEIRGSLLMDSERAYNYLSDRFLALGYTPFLRNAPNGHMVLAVPGRLPETAGRLWVAAIFFFATLLSVLFVGATYEPGPNGEFSLLNGIPFAASILGILLAHEMGHYVVARRLKIPATPPYFIPMPFFLLGTMGAVIQIKAPPRNRRQLLMLGASGPIAGMVVAIPVLLIGLASSRVDVVSTVGGYFQEGNSILYALMKLAVFGQFLPSHGMDVMINSVALAGWAGFLVTGMNLIPAGQLDGGHIAYALLGKRAQWLTWGVVGALAALSLLWQGWLMWAFLVLLLGRVHSVPLDDVTELTANEKLIAAICFVMFVLVFIPIPMTIS